MLGPLLCISPAHTLCSANTASCPLQQSEPTRAVIPFDTCAEFSQLACCSYGETTTVAAWLKEEEQNKYNVSMPFRIQHTIDVSSPRVLVRECDRILEQLGCAASCSPDSNRFVDVSTDPNDLYANSFWI
jgi:hypothetical protein